MTKTETGHALHEAGKLGYFQKNWLLLAENVDFCDVEPFAQTQILDEMKEMVLIPSGDFYMGKLPEDRNDHGDETPRHLVSIEKDILVMKYPITQAIISSLLNYNPSGVSGATLPMVLYAVRSLRHWQMRRQMKRQSATTSKII